MSTDPVKCSPSSATATGTTSTPSAAAAGGDSSELESVQSATSVRVRHERTDITDGPFAVTKEVLAGFYLVECADLDEALALAARLPMARWGTVEVRPVVSADEWLDTARRAGVDLSDEDVRNLP